MKWVRRLILAVVVIVILAVVGVYFTLNSIVRSVVQRQASASLGVPVSVGSAHLALFGGSLSLSNVDVSSPPGFSSPQMFTLGSVSVAVQYGELMHNPVHIKQIIIDHPVLIVEQQGLKLNVQALMSQPSQTPQTSGGAPAQPMKLIIDQAQLNNAEVHFLSNIPGLSKPVNVTIPSVTMNNIGNADGAQNGAAIKDVVTQMATALASKGASGAGLPLPGLQSLGSGLNGALQNVKGNVGGQIQQGLQNLLGGKKNGQ